MKTIYQEQKIAFNAITFKDAIILLSLMDELVELVNKNRIANLYNNLPNEEREKYNRVWKATEIHLSADSTEKILKVLTDLGFESQNNLKDASLEDLTLK
jgi:hypothetical protein